jgi:hypothetical protein
MNLSETTKLHVARLDNAVGSNFSRIGSGLVPQDFIHMRQLAEANNLPEMAEEMSIRFAIAKMNQPKHNL